MKLDATPGLGGRSIPEVARLARELESAGYAGVWSGETAHDAFLPLTIAAAATRHATIGAGIAVALARNPMTVALLGNDLQAMAEGRFILGLGTQVRAHIQRRFSMPWSAPADRMREFILAIRSIWASWATGDRLQFRGEFYQHDLMSPVFDPGPNPYGNPPVLLAAVGPRMAEVAGEAADGLIVHGFATRRYIERVLGPALERGWKRRSNADGRPLVCHSPNLVTGRTEEEFEAARQAARRTVAFYGSTPAYREVLQLHGWESLHDELHRLAKESQWDKMALLIDDEVLDAFAVVGPPESLAKALHDRYEGLIDRLSLNLTSPAVLGIAPDLLSGFSARQTDVLSADSP